MERTGLTKGEKRAAISQAWAEYRSRAAALSSDRRLPWVDYIEADDRAWRQYLAAERFIASQAEAA